MLDDWHEFALWSIMEEAMPYLRRLDWMRRRLAILRAPLVDPWGDLEAVP